MENLLAQVREDMTVYDSKGDKVGTVKTVQLGDEDLAEPGAETATSQKAEVGGNDLVEEVAEALTFKDEIPEEIQNRLRRYGFIRVDAGLLRSDRYVSAEQITNVDGDRVELNATKDELITD